ncbi:MAG: cyclin-dependent kinase inhibitor 3 family protein [Candidatus Baltobacteraceae bacterium]
MSQIARRTSVTDPLQIKALEVPGSGGQIGMTLCPGRRDRLHPSFWDRDLDADLDVVKAWNPAVVLTLVEEHEFALLGVPGFREALARHGLPWLHLPIRDADVPSSAFEVAWAREGPRLRAHLRNGERVLIHCRAGLGRTGTIAGRLLVELGMNAAQAVLSVRAARANAIETEAQRQHVMKATSCPDR